MRRYHGCKDTSVDTNKGVAAAWQPALHDFITEILLEKTLKNAAPRQIIAVWDAGNTYRQSVYGDYKKARLDRERDPFIEGQLKALFREARRFLAALGIKQVEVPGEEADDVIAHLVERLPGTKFVHTVDQDLIVLARHPRTYVWRNGDLFDANSQFNGLPVRLVSLHKSLVGDSSDGYLGVRGFGPKAFDTLRTDLGEAWLDWLQSVISEDQPEALKGVVETHPLLAKLYDAWNEWRVGWRLAHLEPRACYGVYKGEPKRPQWHVRLPNAEIVRSVLAEILPYVSSGSTTLDAFCDRFQAWMPTQRLIDATQSEQLVAIASEIAASPVVSYDFESSDLDQHLNFRENDPKYVDVLSQRLAGISVNYGDNLQHTVYVPFDHANTANLGLDWAVWLLRSLDAAKDRAVVQNAAFELVVAQKNLGYMPRAPYDTRIMRSYVDENEEADLKSMSKAVLNYRQATYAETTQGRMMCELTGEEVLRYGCDDAFVTSALFDVFRLQMWLEGSWDFYSKHEVDPAVDDAWVFIEGTEINLERMSELRVASAKRAEDAEERVRSALVKNLDPTNLTRITVAAKTLLDEAWTTERFKYLDQPEKASDAYNLLWTRAWNACFYVPSTRTEEAPVFSPTLGNLAKLVGLIDPKAPKPPKMTAAAIEDYDSDLMSYTASLKKDSPEAKELQEFMKLLYSARKNLTPAKRMGPAYESLVAFGQEWFDEKLPKKVSKSGSELNFGSGQQMQGFLYGMLGLPIRCRSKPTLGSLREREKLPGSPSTGLKAVASALVWDVTSEEDWRMPVLQDYGVVCKERQLESLYFGKYPNWVHPKTGRIHPQIRNCGTATRRPAGNSPNLLQVAKGSMRSIFPAGEGRVFVSMDFASQELVLTACETKDPVMLDAFMQTPRKDLHSVTASGIAWRILPRLGIPCDGPMSYEDFLKGLHSDDPAVAKAYSTVRNKYAKALVFGIVYGSSPVGVAENMQIPKEDAEQLVDALFRLYRRVPEWQSEVATFARAHGYVEMPFGSRRHAIEDLWSGDRKLAGRQDRQLSNATIQSAAAEILKVVRQRMFDRRMRERYQLRSIFPIYDEITASVPTELATDYCLELAEVMRVTPPGHPVGMEVDVSIGLNWGEQIEIGIPTREAVDAVLAKLHSETTA